jgi:S-adenosylmethionine synthetase
MQNEVQPGSAELVDIFARETLTANDTSAAVGFAPLSETERLVLATENYLWRIRRTQSFASLASSAEFQS